MTDNEKFYAKSMFPSLLGAQTSTIDWRIRNGHPLPKPDMVITGAGRDTYGWAEKHIRQWWESFSHRNQK